MMMKVGDLIALLSAAPPDNDVAIEIDGPVWRDMDGREFRDIAVRAQSDPPGLTILIPE